MLRPHVWLIVTALAASLLVRVAGAAPFDEKRFYVSPFVGWTFFDNERRLVSGEAAADDLYLGGRAGVRLTHMLWLDLAGGTTALKGCADCKETWTHGSANLMLSPASLRTVNPFLSVGFGGSRYKDALNVTTNAGVLEAAGGLRVRLNEFLGLRLEARNALWMPKEKFSKAHVDDVIVGAGLTFSFGGPAEVFDSDGDGVFDDLDQCPATPLGCAVDARGCPTDSDGDEVCGGLDQCPDTPKGCTVNARGCPVDSDGDGVCGGLDQCPDTPRACRVDAHGCPVDSDGDGVCDDLDNCPSTRAGCLADAHGCPIDSDFDGVCDGFDPCPGTPVGTLVDENGCPRARETELLNTGRIRLSNVNFDFDQSTIRPDAYAVLDTVGRVLTRWPGLKVEIGGHTDSRGSAAYNRALSQRRAASVRAYLLEKFPQFKQAQLTPKGYGEDRPLVPNTGEESMQMNRRVEFVVLNPAILKRQD
jgi:outer membrane protein OmpA-like peptidoglycan-associated protein